MGFVNLAGVLGMFALQTGLGPVWLPCRKLPPASPLTVIVAWAWVPLVRPLEATPR